jgi:hypothetical protein
MSKHYIPLATRNSQRYEYFPVLSFTTFASRRCPVLVGLYPGIVASESDEEELGVKTLSTKTNDTSRNEFLDF